MCVLFALHMWSGVVCALLQSLTDTTDSTRCTERYMSYEVQPIATGGQCIGDTEGVGWSHMGNTPLTVTGDEDEGRQFPLGEVPHPPLTAPLH